MLAFTASVRIAAYGQLLKDNTLWRFLHNSVFRGPYGCIAQTVRAHA